MQYFLTSAALVASASLSLAAPAHHANIRRSTFEIQQVAYGKVRRNGPINMLDTYKKFANVGAVAPSEVVIAAAAAQTGKTGIVSFSESTKC